MLHALYAYFYKYPSKERLASEACEIEIDILGEPIGKQDQYAASYGGLNFVTFHSNESVNVEPIIMAPNKYKELERSLLFFYLGGTRSARDILNGQCENINRDKARFNCLVRMTELAKALRDSLSSGRLDDVGPVLNEGWNLKKNLSDKISDDRIDFYYESAKKNGAVGGKLLGAGGSGFLMLYCDETYQDRVRRALNGLKEYKFSFDNFGTKVIYVGENEKY